MHYYVNHSQTEINIKSIEASKIDEILAEITSMRFISQSDFQDFKDKDVEGLDMDNEEDIEDWESFKEYMKNDHNLKDYNEWSDSFIDAEDKNNDEYKINIELIRVWMSMKESQLGFNDE